MASQDGAPASRRRCQSAPATLGAAGTDLGCDVRAPAQPQQDSVAATDPTGEPSSKRQKTEHNLDPDTLDNAETETETATEAQENGNGMDEPVNNFNPMVVESMERAARYWMSRMQQVHEAGYDMQAFTERYPHLRLDTFLEDVAKNAPLPERR